MKKAPFDEVEAVIAGDTYEGWCTECGEWTHDSCEPDARRYKCPVCGNRSCYGAEELLIMNCVDTSSPSPEADSHSNFGLY